MKRTIWILGLLGLIGCAPSKTEVDLLVTNAKIYTVDPSFSQAEAFAVKDGKFVAVGKKEEIQQRYEAPKTVDLGGKTVFPGLFDAHCHFFRMGLGLQEVNLGGTKSWAEAIEKVTEFAKTHPAAVVQGRGWDQNDWEVKEFPTKKELDSLFPDTPVALGRIDGHALLVNQKMLDMAGITGATHVEGGEIVLQNGEPTGVLIDAPMQLAYKVIPQTSRETAVKGLEDAEKICLGYGLTTVNDAGLDRNVIELVDSLQQAGDLSIRMYAMVSNNPANLEYYLNKGIYKTDRLDVRSIKVYADGALGSRGAALKQPYSDAPGHFGAMITPATELESLALRIAKSDYQMNTHAIGDSANVAVLRAYKRALAGQTDRRWKVEHAQVIAPQDFDYFKYGIIPSVQPTHATSDMYWVEDRLGPEREKGAYAYKTLLEKAGLVALGTDFPVEQVNPFLTFYAAVARKDLQGFPKDGFQMDNALSREETLKGMTIWAAYSNFEEGEKGSIEPGKWADFVVLDQDIMTVPEERIPETKAEQTYIAGTQVY